jgi:hypothetical protein
MSTRILISTPYPSVEEVAAELGVKTGSVKKLRRLLDEIVKPASNEQPANGRRTETAKRTALHRNARD